MTNYYAYFDFNKDTDMAEAAAKLAAFLVSVRYHIDTLKTEDEKNYMLNIALQIVRSVCYIFSTPGEKAIYYEYLNKQIINLPRMYSEKKRIIPLEDTYITTKSTWILILGNLINCIESNRQMSFIKETTKRADILNFIVEKICLYNYDDSVNKDDCYICLDILEKSFDIAMSRDRKYVRVEDIVASTIHCELLDEKKRCKLSTMLFDQWYSTDPIDETVFAYQKK